MDRGQEVAQGADAPGSALRPASRRRPTSSRNSASRSATCSAGRRWPGGGSDRRSLRPARRSRARHRSRPWRVRLTAKPETWMTIRARPASPRAGSRGLRQRRCQPAARRVRRAAPGVPRTAPEARPAGSRRDDDQQLAPLAGDRDPVELLGHVDPYGYPISVLSVAVISCFSIPTVPYIRRSSSPPPANASPPGWCASSRSGPSGPGSGSPSSTPSWRRRSDATLTRPTSAACPEWGPR
jgi:hypothetical protein